MAFITAGIIAGGASALGGIAGSIISGNAASSAAAQQAAAAEQANQLQFQEWQTQQQNEQPWLDAGKQALTQMQDPSFQQSFNPTDMETVDPGYNFRLQAGQTALERSAAASGGLASGGTLKALNQYAQNYASNEYNNAFNQFQTDQNNRFGRLSTLAGYGTQANSALAQAGTNYANATGANITGAANASAGATLASGQQWGNTLSSLGSGIGKTWMQATALGNQGNWLSGLTPQFGSSLGSIGSTPNFGSTAGLNFGPAPSV